MIMAGADGSADIAITSNGIGDLAHKARIHFLALTGLSTLMGAYTLPLLTIASGICGLTSTSKLPGL